VQYSSKNSGYGRQEHVDARRCQWMVVIIKYDMADNGRYNADRRRKQPREKKKTHRTIAEEEYSDYHETNSRNMCHIFHSIARHNLKYKQEQHSSSQGVTLWSLQKSVILLGKKFLATLGNARMLTPYP
jgi:hypothetical protein